jgi:hypothetical protein
VDLISRFMQRPWDRTAMQILPRREGDLEMQEGTVFKSWNRYKFVLKDHCMEYHRYLPTGLHDPQILGTFIMADVEVSEFADVSGHQNHAMELRDAKGRKLAVLGASSAREQDAWMTCMREVSKTWETAASAGGGWSTNMASKLSNVEIDENGVTITKASKLQSIEEAANMSSGRKL